LDNPSPDIVELDAEGYWPAVQAVIPGILKESAIIPSNITLMGLWLRDHEREIFNAADKFWVLED
jgi:hypothetical protein